MTPKIRFGLMSLAIVAGLLATTFIGCEDADAQIFRTTKSTFYSSNGCKGYSTASRGYTTASRGFSTRVATASRGYSSRGFTASRGYSVARATGSSGTQYAASKGFTRTRRIAPVRRIRNALLNRGRFVSTTTTYTVTTETAARTEPAIETVSEVAVPVPIPPVDLNEDN